ncbi:MAG: outer membrane lipoprotein chaperone LolA [Magnetococcales bacterium]|nr:outer membrane lipoprotein chaperone LolA [Magnetococcales bacterium]
MLLVSNLGKEKIALNRLAFLLTPQLYRWLLYGLFTGGLWGTQIDAAEQRADKPTDAKSRQVMERLQRFTDQLQTIEGDFVQQVDEDGSTTKRENSGHFVASKPGRFRWDYQQPFQQLVLSDGREIWYYEPDLRQATRSTARLLHETPAAFLVSGVRIADTFIWEVQPSGRWLAPTVHLKPKRDDKSVHEIAITLDPQQDRLLGLMVADTMGHRSWFTFSHVRLNQPVDAQRFQFTPPAGVDIVHE